MQSRYAAARLLLLGLLSWSARAPAQESCGPWPGEFSPLPTVSDPDPLRARWATLRAEQLTQRAARLEERDRSAANRIWQRVLCFQPEAAAAREGALRTRPSAVLQASEPPRQVEPRTPAPVAARAAPGPPPKPKPKPKPEPVRFDEPLRRAEQLIRSARFDEALAKIEELRPRIEAEPGARTSERTRLELLAATAHVAFGDEAAARASCERALRSDPALVLDAHSTPPKLMRAFEAARAEAEPQ
ncbi:MAG: hypothetical protein NTZ61_01130 [Proteobacteria bacterium]|nr:hypothetical protein [Pseudomonadota bacterium]